MPADATHVVACCPLGKCTVPRESIEAEAEGWEEADSEEAGSKGVHHARNSCLNGSPATRRAAASGLRVTKLH